MHPQPAGPAPTDPEAIFATRGWLSEQSAGFRAELLRVAMPVDAHPGASIFREGDQANGLYGIVSGGIGVEGGHPRQTPLMGHIFRTGDWFGVKAPLGGGPRELTYRALEHSRLLFLPNSRLVPLMQHDPDVAIRIGQLAELGNRLGSWVSRDLLTPVASRRLAAVLYRVLGMGEVVPEHPRGFALTHNQLGEMANLSRHHVGRKLAEFEAQGWIACNYNRILLRNPQALAAYAYGDEDG